jgi:hypothetical protein
MSSYRKDLYLRARKRDKRDTTDLFIKNPSYKLTNTDQWDFFFVQKLERIANRPNYETCWSWCKRKIFCS